MDGEKIFQGVMHFIRERALREVVTLLVIFVLPRPQEPKIVS
jgi:hypothetical protein